MLNFRYCNPTKLVFGRGAHKSVGAEFAPFLAGGTKVVVACGSSSARASGVLDAVLASCAEAGLEAQVFEGIRPNPDIEGVRACAAAAAA
ncbi:MAG: iron-containing alcohol dehydrogenase, partial [Duodenibacillus sp.]|nr:iron-containing alcohol dehydrogenase [Duodenibacillus sp.]